MPPIPLPKRLGLRLLRTLPAPDRDSLVCRVPARRSVGYNRTRLALQHPLQSQRVLARVHGVGSLHGHHFTCHPWFVAEPPIAVLHRLLRARPVAEATGYVYEGRLRGLDEPAKAGFAAKSRGLQPPGFAPWIGLL